MTGKKLLRCFLGIFSAAVMTVACALPVHASQAATEQPSKTENGVSVSVVADKDVYETDDIATVTTIVTNTNDYAVRNVSIESALPEGLVLADENQLLKLSRTELLPGESVQLEVKVKVGMNQVSKPPKTGDHGGVAGIMLILLLAVAGAAALFAVGKKNGWNRKWMKKTTAFVLCAALLLPSFGTVQAAGAKISGEMTVSRQLTFGNDSYLYASVVKYEVVEPEEEIPPVDPENPNEPTITPPAVSEIEKVHVKLGDAESETAVNLTADGNSQVTEVNSSVGSLEDTYMVRTMSGRNSSIRFEAELAEKADVTIEIQEIHQREDAFFGYDIYVNGEKVYTRTYEPLSDGPNHFFVEVPASLLAESGANTIEIVNETDNIVRFSNIWVYSDFAAVLENEEVYRPMEVSLMTPKISYEDYEADLELIRQIQAEYSGYDMYTLGMGFELLYMHYETKELQRRLDWLMQLSAETGIPFHLSVNSWWGGTPHGYDGRGNMWTDILYNQVVYDPLNLGGTGEWRLSTPNQWSNTPWLTMNNDYYNQVRAGRVEEIAEYISAKSAEIRAEGNYMPPMTIFTENEPLYWTYSAFNASPDARADFSAGTIQAAAADGVTLNPEDGLSDTEKMWMYKNLNHYVSGIGQAIEEGLGHDAIVIDNGEISYPEYQLIENAYSHMFIQYDDPIADMSQGMWETHMTKELRFGGEWAEEQDSRYLDYIAARGRFSDVNAERGSIVISNHTLLEQAYAAGSNHVMIYNYADGDDAYINGADQIADSPVTIADYARTSDYMSFNIKPEELAVNDTMVAMEDVHTEALGFQYVLTPSKADGASVTFKIDDNGAALEHGLLMTLGGRILSSLDANCKIEIYVGSSEENMVLADTITEITPNAMDLSEYIDKTATEAYVKLVMHTSGNYTLYSWVSLKNITFQIPSGLVSGQTSGDAYTYKETRTNNLWVTYRADAERMLKNYEKAGGRDGNYQAALELIENCNYVSAYDYLVRILSETLPAKYAVKGSGTLGSYPVAVETKDTKTVVNVTLLEMGDSLKLNLLSENAEKVSLTWSGIENGNYALRKLGGGSFEIVPAEHGTLTAVNGKLSVALTTGVYYSKDYPNTFTAMYASYDAEDNTVSIQSHDADISEYVNEVVLELADTVTVTRGRFGREDSTYEQVPLAALVAGDMLELTLNEKDEVTAIRASYGVVSGTVVSLEYPQIKGASSNAFITIQDSEGQNYRFEIGAEAAFDYPSRTGVNILTAPIGDYGLKAGDAITVLYSPYNENRTEGLYRVLELTQPSEIVLSETFETDSWKSSGEGYTVESYTNLTTGPLDTNYTYKVLYPQTTNTPSSIVWKLDNNGQSFGWINVQFSGRCIMGSTMKWSYSTDNSQWTTIREYNGVPDWQSNDSMIDLLLEGITESTVYIKCEMVSGSDTWSSINDITIKKMASSAELTGAVLTADAVVEEGLALPFDLTLSYDDGSTSGLSGADVSFTFSNPGILSYSNGVLTATGVGTTDMYAVVRKNGKTIVTNTVTVTVNKAVVVEWDSLFCHDYEGMTEYTVVDSNMPDVVDSQNVWLERIEANVGLNEMGITNTPVTDGNLDPRLAGYVVYKIDAPEDVFEYLKIAYSGRRYKEDVNTNADMTFSVSTDQTVWEPVETMPYNQAPQTHNVIHEFDISEYARGKSTVYLKVDFPSSRYTWAWLNSIEAFAGHEQVPVNWDDTPIISYDYEDLEEFTTEIPNAVDSENVQIEELEKTANYHDKGLCGVTDPEGTAGEDWHKEGYVVYKIDAPKAEGFEHLKLVYAGRAIMGAGVTFSVSEDRTTWTKVGQMPADVEWWTLNELDISGYADGKASIYVRIDFTRTRYTWAWLNSFSAVAGTEAE